MKENIAERANGDVVHLWDNFLQGCNFKYLQENPFKHLQGPHLKHLQEYQPPANRLLHNYPLISAPREISLEIMNAKMMQDRNPGRMII